VENALERQPNIAAAIRRSRNARAAKKLRARRSAVLAALVSVALAGGGFLTLDSFMGGDAVQAAVAKAESLADLISQRSPGQRTAALLTKTKHARALAKARARPHVDVPSQTELAKVLLPPPSPEVPLDLASPLPMASLTMPPPVAEFIMPPSGSGGGGLVSPPGGGGGGGVLPPGGPETFPNGPREPVPSAVPEPGTWALMLLGFGLVGWRARRTRTALKVA
jgi:hypothetical protein